MQNIVSEFVELSEVLENVGEFFSLRLPPLLGVRNSVYKFHSGIHSAF
jgi:hypothetical protein